jgi:hypothetical protein
MNWQVLSRLLTYYRRNLSTLINAGVISNIVTPIFSTLLTPAQHDYCPLCNILTWFVGTAVGRLTRISKVPGLVPSRVPTIIRFLWLYYTEAPLARLSDASSIRSQVGAFLPFIPHNDMYLRLELQFFIKIRSKLTWLTTFVLVFGFSSLHADYYDDRRLPYLVISTVSTFRR